MIKLVQVAKVFLWLFILNIFIFIVGILLHEREIFIASRDFFGIFFSILNSAVPLVIFTATLLFIIGLVKYIIFKRSKEVDQQKRSEIKKTIIYTGATLFLAIVVWFVLSLLGSVYDKPVIYLYPEQEQKTIVQLDYQGKIIAEYPKYDEKIKGWEVTAYPDGQIINHAGGQEYSYLFWEGKPNEPIN